MARIGFIGCGNMAKAIINGLIASAAARPADIVASDIYEAGLYAAKNEFGIRTTTSNREVAEYAETVFLAVKPHLVRGVISEVADIIGEATIVVSIAAGITIRTMEEEFARPVKLIRLVPNTPALVGAAMTAVSPNAMVTDAETRQILTLLGSFGRCEVVPESLMDAVVAVSGSSPAYVFILIEAMADAAVLEGMPRDKAYVFAAQAVFGSAKMALESSKHPAALKDMVCSPGGTTIEAVAELEKRGFRSSVIEAMRACARRSRELG